MMIVVDSCTGHVIRSVHEMRFMHEEESEPRLPFRILSLDKEVKIVCLTWLTLKPETLCQW